MQITSPAPAAPAAGSSSALPGCGPRPSGLRGARADGGDRVAGPLVPRGGAELCQGAQLLQEGAGGRPGQHRHRCAPGRTLNLPLPACPHRAEVPAASLASRGCASWLRLLAPVCRPTPLVGRRRAQRRAHTAELHGACRDADRAAGRGRSGEPAGRGGEAARGEATRGGGRQRLPVVAVRRARARGARSSTWLARGRPPF